MHVLVAILLTLFMFSVWIQVDPLACEGAARIANAVEGLVRRIRGKQPRPPCSSR